MLFYQAVRVHLIRTLPLIAAPSKSPSLAAAQALSTIVGEPNVPQATEVSVPLLQHTLLLIPPLMLPLQSRSAERAQQLKRFRDFESAPPACSSQSVMKKNAIESGNEERSTKLGSEGLPIILLPPSFDSTVLNIDNGT